MRLESGAKALRIFGILQMRVSIKIITRYIPLVKSAEKRGGPYSHGFSRDFESSDTLQFLGPSCDNERQLRPAVQSLMFHAAKGGIGHIVEVRP